MKFLWLLLFLSINCHLTAQDITLTYKKDDGVTVKNIPIKQNFQIISIEGIKNFKTFAITVGNLPANHKLSFRDDASIEFGLIIANGSKSITSGVDLNNIRIKIFREDDKNVKTEFASILFQILPTSKLTVISKVTALINQPNKVCEPCKFKGNSLSYDYSKNSFCYVSNTKWYGMNLSNGRPIVGHPFSFTVKNINPFRDSVIISNETLNLNTDVPVLFNKAFFSPDLQTRDPKQESILADVFELGEQIKKIIALLKDSKECTDICSAIQQTKDETENHFAQNHNFDSKKSDLISFIIANLDGIEPLYRDSVSTILNNYRNFCNTKNYFNYNIPQIENADQYIFTLSVIPKVGANSYSVVDRKPITVNTVGGLKVDFSSGLFLTRLRDERFSLKPDSTVIQNSYGGDSLVFNKRNQIVQLSDDKNLDFGVAALMHFYPRISPSFNVALSLGAGLSIGPNPAIRYLGGGSLLFGKSARIGMSYGWAAGFVDVLADGYQNQQYISTSDTKAITKKVFKAKNFFAVTLNIPLFKSKVKTDEPKKEDSKEDSTKEDAKQDSSTSTEKK
jgi:hypothetical protein